MKRLILTLFITLSIVGAYVFPRYTLPSTGATIPTAVALFETSLANSLTASGTSMTLVSATTKDGTTLSGTYAFIIDEGTNVEEFVIADCTLTACSNMTRGVSVISGTSSVTALKKAHRRGASVKITDAPQLLILSRVLNGQDTIPNSLSYDSSPVFSSALQIITKGYADALVAAGVATSSESNFGGVWLATQVQMASSTDGGVNKPYVLQSKYATSSCPTTGNWVPITNASTGKLAVGCIDQTGAYTWSGTVVFNGAVTLNATTTLSELTIGTNSVALTASTTMTGGTTPQPVYIASSTSADAGGVLLVDGNDLNTLDFVGFAVTNAATGTTVYVQKDGIVNGFTGLTKGATYYVSDTAGVLATTSGTYDVKVGVAVSATEILVEKGYDEYIGSAAFDTGSHTTESAQSTTTIPWNAKKVVVDISHRSGSTYLSIAQFTLYRKGITSQSVRDYRTVGDVYNYSTAVWSGDNLVITTHINDTSSRNAGTVYFYK